MSEACDWPDRAESYLQTIGITSQMHYGKPPCLGDEERVEVLGKGLVCASKCQSDRDCSNKLPPETAASAHCSLDGLTGYCGLRCGRDSACPKDAQCVKRGLFSLMGICAFTHSGKTDELIL